jgi:hypothetical protein
MKWFWSFSFAKSEGKISKKLPDFYIWVSMCSQKYRRTIKVFYYIYGLQPDVAKSSYGWLSLWLQTKTPKKNNVMHPLPRNWKPSLFNICLVLLGKHICDY